MLRPVQNAPGKFIDDRDGKIISIQDFYEWTIVHHFTLEDEQKSFETPTQVMEYEFIPKWMMMKLGTNTNSRCKDMFIRDAQISISLDQMRIEKIAAFMILPNKERPKGWEFSSPTVRFFRLYSAFNLRIDRDHPPMGNVEGTIYVVGYRRSMTY